TVMTSRSKIRWRWRATSGWDTTAGLSRVAALLLGFGPQAHQLLLGLLDAHAVGGVLEQSLIGRDGGGGLAAQLLNTGQRELHLVEEKVLGADLAADRLIGLDRLAPVALGLPGVADRGAGQRAHRGTVGARQGNLVRGARRRPLPRGIAQVAELEGGLAHRRRRRMPGQD